MKGTVITNTSPGRVVYLDFLRFFATLGVIFIHVCAEGYWNNLGSYNWYVNVTGGSLVRWSVPVFFMISGALFLNPDKDVTLSNILKKYIPRLALAYIFWWFFYSAFCITGDWVLSGEINYKWLKPQTHLWFLPMMMTVYLLIPLLRLITTDEKILRYSLILWAIYIFGSFVSVIEFKQITNLFKLNPVIGYAGYFLSGYYLSRISLDRKHRHIIYLLGLCGAVIGVAGNLMISMCKGEVDDMFLEYLSPHVFLMSIAIFVFVRYNAVRWYDKTGRLMNYVQNDLFGIYLIHIFWLIFINKDYARDMCNQVITLPLITISVFILSLYTTKFIRLIPILCKVVR